MVLGAWAVRGGVGPTSDLLDRGLGTHKSQRDAIDSVKNVEKFT